MKYWSEIVKATLYKLGIEENDDDSTEYTDKMPIIANECLTMIANDLKPCIKRINIDSDGETSIMVTMPEDFLSFAEAPMICMTDDELIYHPEISYYDWNVVILPPFVGKYTLIYNATYGEIPKIIIENQNGAYNSFDLTKSYSEKLYNEEFDLPISTNTDIIFNGIPQSVLNCLPTYIASQLLLLDDAQKSTMLRNEFEVLTERLENKVLLEREHFVSPGGWY